MSESENNKRDNESEENKNENQQTDSREELQKKKLICICAYIFGILFFLPLIFYPEDKFAKFHANQGLVILITAVIGEVVFWVLSIVPVLRVVFSILAALFSLCIFILCVLGILGVVRNEEYKLPIIGQYKLIK